MFQNFGVQKISILEKSSEDLGMHISLPKPYATVSKVSWVDKSHPNHSGLSSSSDSTKWNEDHFFVVQTNSFFKNPFTSKSFLDILCQVFWSKSFPWSNSTRQPTAARLPRPTNCPSKRKHPNLRRTACIKSCFGIPCATYSPRCPIFFSLGQNVSLSFFLLRSDTKKRNKSSSGSPPKKGHFFDFVWWVVSLRAVCIGNALWWKHGVGLNLLGMKPFRFRGYLLLQVITSLILTIWLDHIIFYLTHPIFLGQKIGAGKPISNHGTWQHDHSCGSTAATATQKRLGWYFPQSFPAKHTKTWKKNFSTLESFNISTRSLEPARGSCRDGAWCQPSPQKQGTEPTAPTRSNKNTTNLVEV